MHADVDTEMMSAHLLFRCCLLSPVCCYPHHQWLDPHKLNLPKSPAELVLILMLSSHLCQVVSCVLPSSDRVQDMGHVLPKLFARTFHQNFDHKTFQISVIFIYLIRPSCQE